MLREILWQIVAWVVTRPWITTWLIARAMSTPYNHIYGRDGTLYMGRWWVANPQPDDDDHDTRSRLRKWLPSMRIHWILRADQDRDSHDHPRDARTIVLKDWYREERKQRLGGCCGPVFLRRRGFTGALPCGVYHRITEVAPGGVWTLFFTWKKQVEWGFDVDGVKVPWRQYLGINP